jgi:transformation/transcription domain-associated protein
VALLQTFQQLVELRESARVLLDLAAGNQRGPDHSYGDLKDILEVIFYFVLLHSI